MKFKLLFPALLFSLLMNAQTGTRYWVRLSDKNGSPYSVSNPSAFLSARSLARRAAQNIAVNSSDLPVNPNYISQIQSTGAAVLLSSKWLNAVLIDAPNPTVLSAVNSLNFVLGSTSVGFHKRTKDVFDESDVDESASKVTSSTSLSYGSSLNQIQMLNGVCMHNQNYQGNNMHIAILDAGFQNVNTIAGFDSIRTNNQILGTLDIVAGDTSVYEDYGHGTSVLSCMAGNVPGQLIGTAPKAKYWLIRTEEAATEYLVEEDFWVRGAEFADSVGADIINSSLGYTTFFDSGEDHSYSDLDGKKSVATIAATMAARKGMIVCNSAGNDGGGGWQFISVPADADSILTVGSVTSTGSYSPFSSTGPTADGRIKPDVSAKGSATTVISANSGTVITSNGTSFSSPVLAGMVACLWQANPTKTNMEIIKAIKESASQYQSPDNYLGYGIPNFCAADSILKGLLTIKLYDKNDIIMLSPNPFNTDLSFAYVPTAGQDLTLEILDMQGKNILSEKVSVKQNNLLQLHVKGVDELAKGVYLFVVHTSNGRFTKKVIKE